MTFVRLEHEPKTQNLLWSMVCDMLFFSRFDRQTALSAQSLIALMAPFGASGAAVRLALSRLCNKGWLQRHPVGRKTYFALTPTSLRHMEQNLGILPSVRPERRWSGTWHLLSAPPERVTAVKNKYFLIKELQFLGYGTLAPGTWINPYEQPGWEEVMRKHELRDATIDLVATLPGGKVAMRQLAARCWDLAYANQQYGIFLNQYEPEYEAVKRVLAEGGRLHPEECFRTQIRELCHFKAWRFYDPLLPVELLPEDWLGTRAHQLFEELRSLLTEGAHRFFESLADGLPPLAEQLAAQGVRRPG